MRASLNTGLVGRSSLHSLPGGGGDGSALLASRGERGDNGVCATGDLGVEISGAGIRTVEDGGDRSSVGGDRGVGGGGV